MRTLDIANGTIREAFERREHEMLSPGAAFSDESRGREREEDPCDIRTVYQRDRDRIVHCKAFRRLKDKTQVFLAPEGDHYRTRLLHTLEVSQIARTIAKTLCLNEDLTEAIALGHDLGHTPFGHAGERVLSRICKNGFDHSAQSVRVVECLEKHGQGLNLTFEVRDGIRNHQMEGMPCTMEGQVVRLSDKIAYINHDIDDAIRAKILREEDIPRALTDELGHSLKERLNTLIHDIVRTSGEREIVQSLEKQQAMEELRRFMFEHVYTNPTAKGEEQKAEQLLEALFHYYMDNFSALPEEYQEMAEDENREEDREQVVCDYVAGMTDRFAITKFRELMIPSFWSVY